MYIVYPRKGALKIVAFTNALPVGYTYQVHYIKTCISDNTVITVDATRTCNLNNHLSFCVLRS